MSTAAPLTLCAARLRAPLFGFRFGLGHVLGADPRAQNMQPRHRPLALAESHPTVCVFPGHSPPPMPSPLPTSEQASYLLRGVARATSSMRFECLSVQASDLLPHFCHICVKRLVWAQTWYGDSKAHQGAPPQRLDKGAPIPPAARSPRTGSRGINTRATRGWPM